MKHISVFCSLVFILLIFSPVALCADKENCLTLPENYSHFDEFSLDEAQYVYSGKYFSAEPANFDYTQFFGRLLNKYEKVFYDELCSVDYTTRIIDITFPKSLSEEEFNKISIQRIADAFFLDHPEFFWLTDFSIYYTPTTSGSKTLYNNFQVYLSVYSEYNSIFVSLKSRVEEFNNAVKKLKLDMSSRYDFIKSLHDYLCNNVVYSLFARRCYDAYGALVDGKAVCQGYSEAFKYICDIYKIPCICVIGISQNENHMWNAVQAEDGEWYFVDCTWDDQNTTVIYDYFLCGLKTVSALDNNSFDVSHSIRYKNSDDERYDCLPLVYPSFSKTQYIPDENNKYSGFDLTDGVIADYENKILYTSFFNTAATVYYNGLYRGEFFTGAVFKGDVDCDGVITAYDALTAFKIYLKNIKYTDNQFLLADINNDGKVTLSEARKILKSASGTEKPYIADFKDTVDEISVEDENGMFFNWQIFRFGDVNSDKSCDIKDYYTVLEKSRNNTSVVTIEDFLCDADGNGVINKTDAEIYYSAVSGQYDFSDRF